MLVIERVCLLKDTNNHCPYFNKEKRCTAESTNCSMRVKLDDRSIEKVGYERKPRWFEQYLK